MVTAACMPCPATSPAISADLAARQRDRLYELPPTSMSLLPGR